MSPPATPQRLNAFVHGLSELLNRAPDEATLIEQGGELLQQLISHDDWLPDELAQPSTERYQQYLLHLDPAQRFSVVSFVWGPGQSTPVHDHRVWGLIGMLRGAEDSQSFTRHADGRLEADGDAVRLQPGQVEAVSPRIGDIHQVSNAFDDRVSISIHVYGADIGAVNRAVYREDGSEKLFISGYSTPPSIAQRQPAQHES
ncbi:cysteine dioxygenase [Phytopseudomonas daroniae]|uniref:cysteine dioxygenase family protein n=1 Tax=Phytopseudomonas daroniae TaxID=2487519 RepID=UPI0010385C6A|nr:cysteine dioxygenase [Pseudomonas daroniae]TBU72449.1 cysteine dioxygenase [Pseudomonas daroniae]